VPVDGMYTLERLLGDVAKQRGALTNKGGDYQACWDAFNRYVSAVLEKKQTLSMSNFCKIGWRIEEHPQGKVKMRPHFQVSESFARAYRLDARALPPVSDRALSAAEEFNFSKGAIRFSSTLTKENLFMGMRSILQLLGEAMASGQAVSIDFEVGKLKVSDRVVSFEFSAEMYISEGIEVPKGSASRSDYKPSASFAPPSADALTLSLQGRRDGQVKSHSAFLGGGWEEGGKGSSAASPRTGRPYSASEGSDGGETRASSSASGASRFEVVQTDHLHRHLARVEEDAVIAITEKQQWEEHLHRLEKEKEHELRYAKAVKKEYAQQLGRQINEAEVRRAEGRQHVIENASMHEFPNFTESPDQAVYDYIKDRRDNLKDDLDHQVEIKRRLKMVQKQRERDMEVAHVDASVKEMAQMKMDTSARKELEKAVLHQSWEKDKRLVGMRKVIDQHHRTPAAKSTLSSVGGAYGSAPATPRMELGSSAAPSPRFAPSADFDTASSVGSYRPVTGSVRRVPFGAAASLALHKEKLGQSARR